MEYIYRTSTIFDGCKNIIYYAENRSNKRTGKYIRKNRKKLERYLHENGLYNYKIEILQRNFFGKRSVRRLILRNDPTITARQLEERIKEFHNNSARRALWSLLCITDIKQNPEDATAQIVICDEIDDNDPETGVMRFLNQVISTELKNYANINTTFSDSSIHYSIPDDRRRFYITNEEEEEENRDLLATELLADSVYPREEVELSPLIIDAQFNMSLSLYPQISIKLEPFHKAIYILFLRHPEGIVLKQISSYSDELKHIYIAISGRQNISVVNKLIQRANTPTDNLLHKSLSVIRKTFISNLRMDIAKHYIPSTGHYNPKQIPLDRKLVKIEKEM